MIHLNHAGASLMPEIVVDAVIEHLRLEARIGGYEAADAKADELRAVHRSIATLVGASGPDEIALFDSATRAWNAVALALPVEPRQVVITSQTEYASNALSLLVRGITVEVAPSTADGSVDAEGLAARLSVGDVAFVAVSHVPTESGLVQPAASIGAACRDAGVPFLLDACQAAGQLPLDVAALGCDALTATGRKFVRGPRGTGFAYVRRDLAERLRPNTVDLHSAAWTAADHVDLAPGAQRFEMFEANLAARLGLGAAVDLALDVGLDTIADRCRANGAHLRARLAEIGRVTVCDPPGADLCAIVTCSVEGHDPDDLCLGLRAAGVNTSVSRITQARFDFEARGLPPSVLRLSPHHVTTPDEIEQAVEILSRTIA